MGLDDPPILPFEFWTTDRFRDPFASRNMGYVLRAYRTDPQHRETYGENGITQTRMARWLKISQAELSAIETGRKVIDSLRKNIEYAQAIGIPRELLWFDLPYEHEPPGTTRTGSELAVLRQSAGLTQEEFADRLRVNRSTVIRWEAGERTPQPHQWPKIAKVLGVARLRLAEVLTQARKKPETTHEMEPNPNPFDSTQSSPITAADNASEEQQHSSTEMTRSAEPNLKFRKARESTPSPTTPGYSMSRAELAEAVNEHLRRTTMKDYSSLDARAIGRYERGEIQWPTAVYRTAFRAVLGASSDADLGFYPPRRAGSTSRSPIAPASDESAESATPGRENGEFITDSSDTTLMEAGMPELHPHSDPVDGSRTDDEIAAMELSRRVSYSGVGSSTLDQLQQAFDSLATDYPVSPPAVLLPRVRGHLRYVTKLMDSRKTLAERIRLTTTAGWLSLLSATINIDLKRYEVAVANLQAASDLAKDVENSEIRAWCYETAAWKAVTDGDYRSALELSQAAQNLAPEGSSIAIQASAQEGRALARLGDAQQTYEVLNRVHRLVSTLPRPEHPEHHYRYDPDKSTSYTATTLAWVGDPAAEAYAREVIERLSPSEEIGKWPRRVATAKLDLSLALIAGNQLDEASATAQQAILSGRIVPSNRWRAAEIVDKIERQRVPEAAELRDAFNTVCPPPS